MRLEGKLIIVTGAAGGIGAASAAALRAAGADVVACDVIPAPSGVLMSPTRVTGKAWSRHLTASTGCSTPRA